MDPELQELLEAQEQIDAERDEDWFANHQPFIDAQNEEFYNREFAEFIEAFDM